MPGFTHLQSAQPVTLGHHLMAYYEMLRRDRSRFADARARLNECPLGAAALAGTGFPIDREATALALGFDRPTANSLDAVSDRDFALDYLMAAAQCALHLSRLAEELILWASQPFGFVALSDAFSTGSSIMPQKRNPDAAELVRGHSGRIAGAMVALVTVMKGLPLAYSKDMQDDKQPVFEAHDLLVLSLAAMAGMVETTAFDADRMRAAAEAGHATATDLADWLVREAGVPFREAHHIAGRVVRLADERGVALWALPPEALQDVDPRIEAGVFAVLSPDASVKSRTSYGGTAPSQVRKRIEAAKKVLGMKAMRRRSRLLALALGRLRPARAAASRRPAEAAVASAADGEPAADHRRAAGPADDRPPRAGRRAAAPLRGARGRPLRSAAGRRPARHPRAR